MTMTKDELRIAIDRLVEAGDEKMLERFVLDNFAKLPEDAQKEMLFAFYADALEKEADSAVISTIQKEGLDALEKLEWIKIALQEKH